MPRRAREKSKTGIYHIMLRGIDKRNIFLDDEDRSKFIEKLIKAKEIADFKLYGYCLMDNHVHLIIEESEEIGNIIKRITIGYIHWHNNKHGRTGHLFANRYKSETVEEESYLINLLRYIHQNPVKAKIVNYAKEYAWSSYGLYISAYENTYRSFLDTELIIEAYLKDREGFEKYMNKQTNDEFLDYKVVTKYSDVELKNKITEKFDLDTIKQMDREDRNKTIKKIHGETNVSIRQLSRVLGLGKTIIEYALKQDD